MEKKYCNVCGAELKENSKFCEECGEKNDDIKLEEKNEPQYQTVETPIKNEVNINKNENYTKNKKSPLNSIFKIVLIIALIGGIVYAGIWIYAEFFSINTPPIYPDETNTNSDVSTTDLNESSDVKVKDSKKAKNSSNTTSTKTNNKDNSSNITEIDNSSNTTNTTKIFDTEGIDGITDIKYQMSDIAGTWYVSFKNYVSLEGEVIGLYQSYSNVKIEKIDDINFSATFNVVTAEINGEPVAVGEKVFYGKLENDNISMQMNCEDDFLYTGMSYNVEFVPEVKNGKLSGNCEKKLSKVLEGHNMEYRVVTEFVQN